MLTIGKFDGVHRGHQAVLANVLEKAKSLSLPATVMVFEPQPEEVFMPDKAPARISPLREKYELLANKVSTDCLLCDLTRSLLSKVPIPSSTIYWWTNWVLNFLLLATISVLAMAVKGISKCLRRQVANTVSK